MDVSGYHHEGSITIGRPPADVYAVLSDITRMGELSPVCTGGTWDDPAQAGTTGATFTGDNAIGDVTWTTHCRVVTAEPGKEFTFINRGQDGKADLVRWGYTLEPEGSGTKVTETWQVLPGYPEMVGLDKGEDEIKARIDGMAQLAQDGIRDTLAKLKQAVEA